MYRSWTAYKMAEVKLAIELDKDGDFAESDAHFTAVTWEDDDDRYTGQTEEGAKSIVMEVCNWCLGAKLPSTPVVQIEEDEAGAGKHQMLWCHPVRLL
jgi:hypothetical protein